MLWLFKYPFIAAAYNHMVEYPNCDGLNHTCKYDLIEYPASEAFYYTLSWKLIISFFYLSILIGIFILFILTEMYYDNFGLAYIFYASPLEQISFFTSNVDLIVNWICGDFFIAYSILNRFLSTYYLFSFILAAVCLVHISVLYQYGNTDPLNIPTSSYSDNTGIGPFNNDKYYIVSLCHYFNKNGYARFGAVISITYSLQPINVSTMYDNINRTSKILWAKNMIFKDEKLAVAFLYYLCLEFYAQMGFVNVFGYKYSTIYAFISDYVIKESASGFKKDDIILQYDNYSIGIKKMVNLLNQHLNIVNGGSSIHVIKFNNFIYILKQLNYKYYILFAKK